MFTPKKLNLAPLIELAEATHESSHFLTNLIVAEVRAHIGHYQCEFVEASLKDKRCTVCVERDLGEFFGVPPEATKVYYDVIHGKGAWGRNDLKYRETHRQRIADAEAQAIRHAQAIMSGEVASEGVVTYEGDEPEAFVAALEKVFSEGDWKAETELIENKPTTH